MNLKNIVLVSGLCVCGMVASVSGANAAVFVVPGFGPYDITTVETTYSDSTALLESQVWWGSQANATTFATAVGDDLGLVNPPDGIPPNLGPFFAYNFVQGTGVGSSVFNGNNQNVVMRTPGGNATRFYAVATAVPEPLSILGAMTALGLGASFKRKLGQKKG